MIQIAQNYGTHQKRNQRHSCDLVGMLALRNVTALGKNEGN